MRKSAVSGVLLASISAAFLFLTTAAFSIDKQVPGAAYKQGEIIVKFKAGAAEVLEKQLSKGETAGAQSISTSLNELNRRHKVRRIQPLVKGFKAEKQRIRGLFQKNKTGLTKREERLLRRLKRAPKGMKVPELDRIYRIELEEGQSAEQAVAEYRQNPDVEYAELNYIVHTYTSPNDLNYNVQWALNNTGQPYPIKGGGTDSGTAGADINAPEAWDLYTGNSETIVAVIDTGVDYTHGDLIGNLWTDASGRFGYDFVNDDNDPMDDQGHGTHCAGIIAARGNNGTDTAGACWNARIMAVKFLNAEGSGNSSDGASAVYYAVNNGAEVLSNSWGGGGYSESLEEAINYAYSQGVIVVAAAGNESSSEPHYPAYYDHVISAAATDSDDQKASFSSYGEWVDIAAPGVDILSLRGQDTDMYLGNAGYNAGDRFVPFGDPNATMYIASGTSMSCPYIAGACALMLSANPLLTSEEVNDILAETADPIADGICQCDGRLNLFGALAEAIRLTSRGRISMDSDYYNCDSNVGILLVDGDLSGEGEWSISITTTGGDSETVIMAEESPPGGVFASTINITGGEPNIEDGNLQVTNEDIIYATYYDANDGTGNPATVTDTATIDCVPPVISNVQMDVRTSKLIVTFNSDEPAAGEVSCGPVCGGPYGLTGYSSVLTSHTIEVSPLLPYTTYYFAVTATDAAGNEAVDSNSGNCYSFTTTGPSVMYVPSQYATIQDAVDRAWPGSVIWVADGNYTGAGNRDIDFEGKAIAVRSENGPENCIINCDGTEAEPHRGFVFQNGEGNDSVLDGFTITNGRGPLACGIFGCMSLGGGIFCLGGSPTISNCVLSGNSAGDDGGGLYAVYSNPIMTNCTFNNNSAGHRGGGMFNGGSSPILTNCTFTGNQTLEQFSRPYGGGGIYNDTSAPELNNCTFSNNSAGGDGAQGGGMYNIYSYLILTDCTFSGNSGFVGGGISNMPSDFFGMKGNVVINNCIFTNNSAQYSAGIHNEDCHLMLNNCTLSGNSAIAEGGGVSGGYIYFTAPEIFFTNCIFWGNSDSGGSDEPAQIYFDRGGLNINYNCVQGWSGALGGTGNINADPCFVGGPSGNYYLSQITSGQTVDSPCVDSGSDMAAELGMNIATTRTDGIGDTGIVDMGYHYPADITVESADIDENWHIDFFDFAILAGDWLKCSDPCDSSCTETEPPAGDIACDYYVNVYDLALLAESWLDCLVRPASSPNPADGAISVDPNVVLKWTAGAGTLEHDVYLGTDANGAADANHLSDEFLGTVSDVNFGLYSLDLYTNYFWRIDEVGPVCTAKGDVWSFKTKRGGFEPYLISRWKFDEGSGTTAYDSVSDNDGAITGATWTTGQIDGALSFDGDSDYVLVGDESNLEQQVFTLSFWVQLNDPYGLEQGGITKGRLFGQSTDFSYEVNFHDRYVRAAITNTSDEIFGVTDTITDSNWHMLSMTAGDGVLTLYKDGVFADNRSYTGTIDYAKNYNNFVIGARDNGDFSFNGKIDDVRFYDGALSAEEVEQLYQQRFGYKASNPYPDDGATGVEPNTIIGWSPGKDAASHDVYFGTDFNDVNDANTSSSVYIGNFDVNSWDPCGLEFMTTYYWRIDEVNASNLWKGYVWSFKTGSDEPNFVNWWKFDEGSGTTADDSAGSNDGTLVNGPVWTTGITGGALSFDGSDDYVSLSSFTVSTDNGTIALWFETSADFSSNYGGQGYLISQNSLYVSYLTVAGNGTEPYQIYGETNSQDDYFVNITGAAPVDVWNHIAMTFYNKQATTYINGTFVQTLTVTGSSLTLSRIGGRTQEYFTGKIDDVRVYDRELTAEEVEDVYEEGL